MFLGFQEFTFIFLTCVALSNTAVAQDSSNMQVVQKAMDAIRKKDIASLKSYMAAECTIAGLDPKTSLAVLPQIIENFADFSGSSVDSQSPEQGNTRMHISLNYSNGKIGHPDLLLNSQHQIIELNIIRSPKIKAPAASKLPAQVSLPFQLINGCIYVKGSVNGTSGLFMIDSGAFGLVMNRGMFPNAIDTVNYGKEISGVNGQVSSAAGVKVTELLLGEVSLHDIKAIAMPMEKYIFETGMPNLGLIGYSLLSQYAVTYDYHAGMLQMSKVDSLGNELQADAARPIAKIPFSMQRHLPVITAKINKNTYNFALDCGASDNLIYRVFDAQWKALLSETEVKTLSGIDGKVSTVSTGFLDEVLIGEIPFKKMSTAFTTNNLYTQTGKGAFKIDGILGYPFFSSYKMKINYQKKELLLIENQQQYRTVSR